MPADLVYGLQVDDIQIYYPTSCKFMAPIEAPLSQKRFSTSARGLFFAVVLSPGYPRDFPYPFFSPRRSGDHSYGRVVRNLLE